MAYILLEYTACESACDSMFQMIVRDQGADGKLSNKARMSYDKHLVE